ncbi:MAG: helicase HerA domain-containing protein [Hyphomicrobium sp.]
MHLHAPSGPASDPADLSIGRIVSVTGSKAIVLLDSQAEGRVRSISERPEMGTLLAIDTANTIVLAIVSALSVPVPAQREGDSEIWIAELGLVGELWRGTEGRRASFNRGVTAYPALGDRCRVASKPELEIAFCGDTVASVRVGCIRQDSSIPAMVRVDDLLGKHFAILGTTGTGKSCTTALILRAILEKNPAAHIVLLDPHNEYSTAFTEWAEVISPRNMSLPFWMLTFEEIVEVLVGDPERKAEIEILQDLIPIAKSRYSNGRAGDAGKLRRGAIDTGRYTCDTPVPYRISDLTGLIDERMGKLENKRDLAPYRQLKNHIENITQDARYGFMFGSLTVFDGMTQVLGRIFRVPVNDKPITILELTGLPTEIVNVVVSVLCRITFDFALWGEGQVPVTLVCEEAHRYVPANAALGFEPCKRAIAKIAKEGRKYGASLCIVTQRPAEIDATILSQCNTVFALRMANDKDQAIVQSAVSDTGSGLLEFLPSLGQREAIAFGDGMSLPVRIKFDELPKHALPRSSTARFSEKWQKSTSDDGFLEQIVDRWRASGLGSGTDNGNGLSMMAEAMANQSATQDSNDADAEPAPHRGASPPVPGYGATPPMQPRPGMPRRDAPPQAPAYQPSRPVSSPSAHPATASANSDRRAMMQPPPPISAQPAAGASLRSLRDRLTRAPE